MTMKSVTIIAAILSIYKLSVALQDTKGELFWICPEGHTNSNSNSEVIGRSPMDCVRKCFQTNECSGVNMCPDMSGQFTCEMTDGLHQGECTDLTAASQPSCYYAQRVDRSTCENGGTFNGTHCLCPLPFAGSRCHRYMRDCSEGYENGHQDDHQGVYFIQPISSPAPFLVQCEFAWGGLLYPLWRVVSGTPWSNVTWEQAKEGFGDDLSLRPDSTNFFIGLEKLHQILKQGMFNSQVQSKYGASWNTSTAFYNNFTVGPELSSYALSYDVFFDKPITPSSNGLNGSSPIVFATMGKDPNGCAGSNGAAGWYGSDCGGHSMFADPPTWPVPGQGIMQLREVLIALVRAARRLAPHNSHLMLLSTVRMLTPL